MADKNNAIKGYFIKMSCWSASSELTAASRSLSVFKAAKTFKTTVEFWSCLQL